MLADTFEALLGSSRRPSACARWCVCVSLDERSARVQERCTWTKAWRRVESSLPAACSPNPRPTSVACGLALASTLSRF
jgi:hypothetical protein